MAIQLAKISRIRACKPRQVESWSVMIYKYCYYIYPATIIVSSYCQCLWDFHFTVHTWRTSKKPKKQSNDRFVHCQRLISSFPQRRDDETTATSTAGPNLSVLLSLYPARTSPGAHSDASRPERTRRYQVVCVCDRWSKRRLPRRPHP